MAVHTSLSSQLARLLVRHVMRCACSANACVRVRVRVHTSCADSLISKLQLCVLQAKVHEVLILNVHALRPGVFRVTAAEPRVLCAHSLWVCLAAELHWRSETESLASADAASTRVANENAHHMKQRYREHTKRYKNMLQARVLCFCVRACM